MPEYVKYKTNSIADFLSRIKNYEINAQIEPVHVNKDNKKMAVEMNIVYSQQQNSNFVIPIYPILL